MYKIQHLKVHMASFHMKERGGNHACGSEGVHGAVAKATGWSAPTQGSNSRCRIFMLWGLFLEFSYQNKKKHACGIMYLPSRQKKEAIMHFLDVYLFKRMKFVCNKFIYRETVKIMGLLLGVAYTYSDISLTCTVVFLFPRSGFSLRVVAAQPTVLPTCNISWHHST